MSHKHRSQFDEHKRVQFVNEGETMTHQSFTEECDINRIVGKYMQTGILPQKTQGLYGDYSNPMDYQEACNLVIKAEAQFAALPANVRDRFANQPAKFLEWTQDGANAEEMAKLGLMKPEAVQRVANAKKAASDKKSDSKKDETK